MRKIVLATLLSGGLVLGLMATTWAHEEGLVAKMNGVKEVPGPGDPDATGKARVDVNDEAGEICFKITFDGMKKPNAGHIHEGSKTESGDVVVTLFGEKKGSPIKGCVASDEASRIAKNPRNFYVNLHNADFPNGAIRGQLKKRQ